MYFPKPAINENDLAIIERGDTAEHSIEAGQYVSWKGKFGKAVSAILQGATLDDSLFSYETDGMLNDLNNNFVPEQLTGSDANHAYMRIGKVAILCFRYDGGTTASDIITGMPKAKYTAFAMAVGASGLAGLVTIAAGGTTLSYTNVSGGAGAKWCQLVYIIDD